MGVGMCVGAGQCACTCEFTGVAAEVSMFRFLLGYVVDGGQLVLGKHTARLYVTTANGKQSVRHKPFSFNALGIF